MSFNKFFGEINKSVRKIQRADQKTKLYWLIGSTVVVMVIIIFLWVWYLNINVPNINQIGLNAEDNPEMEEKSEKRSFFSNLGQGLKQAAGSTIDAFKSFSQKIGGLINEAKIDLENVKEYTPPSN